MAEFPVASEQVPYVEDDDLWFANQESPTLYLFALRMQGRVGPPPGWCAIRLAQVVPELPLLQ